MEESARAAVFLYIRFHRIPAGASRTQCRPEKLQKGLLIKAYAPCIDSDHCLALCGNQKALGDWNPDKAALMSDIDFPEWQVEVDAGKISFPLEYKFVLYNKKERRAVAWENNPNRYMADPQIAANETLAVGDRYVYFNLPAWKGSGVAVPVFSLRSEKSFGVGDFGDLKRMIDWAVATNQKAVQILPINDTTMTHTWTDSYPYSSISIYAFHPMYADLKQLGSLKDKKVMAEFNKRQKELNALPAVDYEAVNKTKWEYFHLIFKQEGEKVLASDAFRNFYEANKEWLQPYAVFSYLRDAYKTPNFREWPKVCHLRCQGDRDIVPAGLCRLSAYCHLLLHPVQSAPATACRHRTCARQRRSAERRHPHRHQPQQCGSLEGTPLLQPERPSRCTAR